MGCVNQIGITLKMCLFLCIFWGLGSIEYNYKTNLSGDTQ